NNKKVKLERRKKKDKLEKIRNKRLDQKPSEQENLSLAGSRPSANKLKRKKNFNFKKKRHHLYRFQRSSDTICWFFSLF
ncbi:unnamed protein product, partial [Arabidopsis halleri]